MSQPIRVQRKRVKGYKMPENTVSVTRPGKWGNPYAVGDLRTRLDAYMAFQDNIKRQHIPYPSIAEIKKELKGKNLACFCNLSELCHADILLKIANS